MLPGHLALCVSHFQLRHSVSSFLDEGVGLESTPPGSHFLLFNLGRGKNEQDSDLKRQKEKNIPGGDWKRVSFNEKSLPLDHYPWII